MGGRIIKEPNPHKNWKPKVVEGGGGFCLETPFPPWKLSSVHQNYACGLALKGGAGWMALFWGVSSLYMLKKQPWDTDPEITQGTQARSWRSLFLSVASSWFFTPARIWHLQCAAAVGLWPISNLWWHFSPSTETSSLRFLLHLTNKPCVWHF